MDTFTIISIEKKWRNRTRQVISRVPNNWVSPDKKSVLWPPNNQEKFRNDVSSCPMDDWVEYPCRVRRENIKNVSDADKLEALFLDAPDTDSEKR